MAAGWAERLDRHGTLLAMLVSLPSLATLLQPGWFEGHDDLHIIRMIEYDRALRDGQIPPRWFPDVSAGLGNPHPLYYAPLFYMAAESLHLMGVPIIPALKGALVLFTLLAAAGMQRYARGVLGGPASVVAAAAYTYAPYHLLDLYVRKAFSEYTVFAMLPWMLLAFRRLRFVPGRDGVLLAGVCAAGALLSHTISAMLVPPLLGLYAVCLSRQPDAGGPRARAGWSLTWLPRAGAAAALAGSLSAFFLLPAFLEREAVNLEIFTASYFQFHKHFVMPSQLLWSKWGFGMSYEGPADGLSFRIGSFGIAGIALAAAGLARLRASRRAASETVFHVGIAAAAAFMTLGISLPVWRAVPMLAFVQFPWRFLTLVTLAAGFLSGAAFQAWAARPLRVARLRIPPWVLAGTLAAAIAAAAAAAGMLQVNRWIPAHRVGFQEKPYLNMIDRGEGSEPLVLDGSFVLRNTLRWLDHLPAGVGFTGLTPEHADLPKVQIVEGDARVRDVVVGTDRVRARVEAASAARVRVNVHRFPGWVARVNGEEAPLVSVTQPRQLLLFDVPPGSHAISADFERTAARTAGDLLTLAGLAAAAAAGLWPRRAPARRG
ncbi:MAG TPA: hypothetical protein VJV23_06045 [Candidatus Polarisedimenticolia bacterium]|nr:hypothetical protein [Candidatus Polarisedimenticolia bacterium]